jgi:SAM-dependent methyltransferase
MDYTKINAQTIDRWVEEGWEYGKPINKEECAEVRNGKWKVFLTPTKPVPTDWFPNLKDKKLLGLASGGGQQMPVFALLGADCTVLDYSNKQLESEKLVAEREGYKINIVKADMTKRLPFDDNTFDIIFHPVSNVYIEDVYHVFNECFRVLKNGGILLSGLDNGINFLIDNSEDLGKPLIIENKLPYNPLKNPQQMEKLLKEDSGVQFSHTFDEQIGGQLKAGFILVGAFEDFNTDKGWDIFTNYGIPSFWATKALKNP